MPADVRVPAPMSALQLPSTGLAPPLPTSGGAAMYLQHLGAQVDSLSISSALAPRAAEQQAGPVELNGFSSVAMQLLWHVDTFRSQLSQMVGSSDPILSGMQTVMSSLSENRSGAISQALLRVSLPSVFGDSQRFQMGPSTEAAEPFDILLSTLASSTDQRFVSCLNDHFRMRVSEMCECSCDEMLEPMHYMQCLAYVSVPVLLKTQHEKSGNISAQLSMAPGPFCPTANCSARMQIQRYLTQPAPLLIAVGLAWENGATSQSDITDLVGLIDTDLDIQEAFKGVSQPGTAVLQSMLCLAPTQQYCGFSYDGTSWKWYDETTHLIIGEEWYSVALKCSLSCYRPSLLLYQVQ